MVEQGLSLALVGGLISGSGFALLGLFLWRLGYLNRGAERVQHGMMAAVALSSAWGFATAIAEASEFTGPHYAESALDALRYSAWLLFLLLVLRRPLQRGREAGTEATLGGQPGQSTPTSDLARALTGVFIALVLGAAGSVALSALRGDYEIGAARYTVLPMLGMAVLGLVLVDILKNWRH